MLKNLKLSFFLILAYSPLTFAEDLITIYQQALASDPTLHSALTKANIGKDLTGQSFGQMLPQINASANWSKNEQSFNSVNSKYNGTRYFISLNQPLLDFEKFWGWKRSSQI